MNQIAGKPQNLKQVNRSIVRRAIRGMGTATRGEIVAATGISVTTVRMLLAEMVENGELLEAGYDESAGGRKAMRYELNKNRFCGAAFCLDGENIYYLIVNICGEIQERGSFEAQGDASASICAFLDKRTENTEFRSVGIGVPGIVNGLEYRRKNEDGSLERHPIGEVIRRRYHIPVILENDLNAVTLGFGHCYLKEFPEENCEEINMAYLSFSEGCLSAGFLSGGRLLRGWNNFVGELGLFPTEEDATLDELLESPLDDAQYSRLVARLIAGICCVLNPRYVALGGEMFRRQCLPMIAECFDCMLPDEMKTEIVYAEDKWHDYFEGMAYLTAEHIFEEVVLTGERQAEWHKSNKISL